MMRTALFYSKGNEYSKSPDDDVFVQLAATYSQAHLTMPLGNNCPDDNFRNGITNGNNWYTVKGSFYVICLNM